MSNSYMKELSLYTGKKNTTAADKYRTVGIVMFVVSLGTCFTRILVNILPQMNDTLTDIIFTCLIQLGFLVCAPILIYKLRHKMTIKEICAFSSIKKTKWFNYALAVPIGIIGFFVSMGLSSFWQVIISKLGYTHSSSVPLPETFSFGLMLLNFVLTAVLPGICEEFTCRGGFTTVMRKSFLFMPTIIICSIQFGLFHQNITQVFYTAFFGGYMAFLTIKTKSIFPAMIMHFLNNGISVYLDFAESYNFFGGGLFKLINLELVNRPLLVVAAYILLALLFAGLTAILIYLNGNRKLEKKKDIIAASGFDHTNNRVVLFGEENKDMVRDLDLDNEVYGKKLEEELFKPKWTDNIFFIGAIVTSVASTIFSLLFGMVR